MSSWPNRHKQPIEQIEDFALRESETLYNVGRALHQCGQARYAALYYERCLALPPSPATFHAAHNLALIYEASGALDLARAIVAKHFVL